MKNDFSGGQKARISLARAIYEEADVYLLDDPLAAVDSKVANRLYSECINGFLANKTRILITHRLMFLENAENIVLLENGKVTDQGKFKDLVQNDNPFLEKLKHESSTDDLNPDEPDNSEGVQFRVLINVINTVQRHIC